VPHHAARRPVRPAPTPHHAIGGWLVAALLALLVLALTVPYRVGVGDTYLQLLTGRYIPIYGIPHLDPFSYLSAASGHPYVEHEWLTCVLFAALYQHLGVTGLVLYKVLCVGGTALCLTLTARRLGASPATTLLMASLALLLLATCRLYCLASVPVNPHLSSRPHGTIKKTGD
jgi:hypothetical protein